VAVSDMAMADALAAERMLCSPPAGAYVGQCCRASVTSAARSPAALTSTAYGINSQRHKDSN